MGNQAGRDSAVQVFPAIQVLASQVIAVQGSVDGQDGQVYPAGVDTPDSVGYPAGQDGVGSLDGLDQVFLDGLDQVYPGIVGSQVQDSLDGQDSQERQVQAVGQDSQV